jgi:hypothetical protein
VRRPGINYTVETYLWGFVSDETHRSQPAVSQSVVGMVHPDRASPVGYIV